MFKNFINSFKAPKNSRAPEWFCKDMQNGVEEAGIKEKIRNELYLEIERNNFNKELWTEEAVSKMTSIYYGFFEQLYMESA